MIASNLCRASLGSCAAVLVAMTPAASVVAQGFDPVQRNLLERQQQQNEFWLRQQQQNRSVQRQLESPAAAARPTPAEDALNQQQRARLRAAQQRQLQELAAPSETTAPVTSLQHEREERAQQLRFDVERAQPYDGRVYAAPPRGSIGGNRW